MYLIPGGGAYIQAQIDCAVMAGLHQVIIKGEYEIEKTVLLPSDFTLILEDCYLRMKDDTFCNMFANSACFTQEGRTAAGAQHHISIEGRGRAILDGGEYNGLSEKNSEKDGRPHISVNNLILMSNVEHFRVTGLHLRNQRWWACNFVACRHGLIRDLDFLADCSYMDNGVRKYGIEDKGEIYANIYIKNADGIDLRAGCHDILVEHITGFTEDDTVAVTGLRGSVENLYGVRDLPDDIYNITIRDVNASAVCAIVRLLNQGGVKMYNVLVDGVMDASKGSACMRRGMSGVRVGDTHQYGEQNSMPEDTCGITIRNVCARSHAVMRLGGVMSDCRFENIRGFDGYGMLVDNQALVDTEAFWK